ncbi:helix-turn-helix domain-containing protein [Bdellovibrio bacteriovorus]|uniref:helix-turn-helix domain-containing protein n=1 Tax=Bdellovibrio bacteriovorus TaxID=959 RepID=UPI0035A643DB
MEDELSKADSLDMTRRKRTTTGPIFAANLKLVLKERGLSSRAGAEIAGVPASTFSQWLAGTVPLDLESVHRFAKGVGVDFQWLLIGKTEPPPVVSIKDFYDVSDEPDLSGVFLIEAKRLKPKQKK